MLSKTIQIPKLHSAQIEIKRAAKRFNVECCGRRFGKNVLQHELCVDILLDGLPVGWGTPTYKNMADDWRTMLSILAPVIVHKSEQEKRIEIDGGGVLEMWTLDNPEPIRGRRYKRFLINEAASVILLMDIWNQIIRPTLIDLTGDAWFFGTPKGRNAFYQLYTLGLDKDNSLWQCSHYTSYDNPHISPAELDQLKATMTERDYRQEILAEFLEGEGQVMRNIEACMSAGVTYPAEHKGHYLVAGVDWGKHNDYTAISVGCATCRREVALDRFNKIDYEFQRHRLMGILHKWGVTHTLAEQNSMGEPIIEQLQRDSVSVSGFITTVHSKMALIENLSLDMEKGNLQLIDEPVARAELEALERTMTQTGLSRYAAPEGLHDDTVIARALMVRLLDQSIVVAERQRHSSGKQDIEVRNRYRKVRSIL